MAEPRGTRPESTLDDLSFIPTIPGTGKMSDQEILFKAHIIDVRDASNPTWNTSYDMGRADPKIFYGSFNRTVSVNFIVVATTEKEHRDNYISLRKLALLTYPIYRGSRQGYNAPHVYFKIGKLITAYGYVTNIDYAWDSSSPWIDQRPIITEVGLNISILGDSEGIRPRYDDGNYKYFTSDL